MRLADHEIPPTCRLEVHASDGAPAVVEVVGDLDSASSADLLAATRSLLDAGTDVDLDLGGVSFLDSVAVSTLLQLAAHAERRRRQLRITEASDVCRSTAGVLGVDHLLPLEGEPGGG